MQTNYDRLTLENSKTKYVYQLTELLELVSPREMLPDDINEIKRDGKNRNFLKAGQIVIYNHFTECKIEYRKLQMIDLEHI